MKWEREQYEHDDGQRYCWKLFLGDLGEVCIDRAEWIDPERPWLACWYVGAHETEIGRTQDEASAKALVAAWVAVQETKLNNARAQPQMVDEE